MYIYCFDQQIDVADYNTRQGWTFVSFVFKSFISMINHHPYFEHKCEHLIIYEHIRIRNWLSNIWNRFSNLSNVSSNTFLSQYVYILGQKWYQWYTQKKPARARAAACGAAAFALLRRCNCRMASIMYARRRGMRAVLHWLSETCAIWIVITSCGWLEWHTSMCKGKSFHARMVYTYMGWSDLALIRICITGRDVR